MSLKSKSLLTVFSLSLLAAGFLGHSVVEPLGNDGGSWEKTLVESHGDQDVDVGRHNYTVSWWTEGSISSTVRYQVFFRNVSVIQSISGNSNAQAAELTYQGWNGTVREVYLPRHGALEELYYLCGHEKQHAKAVREEDKVGAGHSFGFKNTMGSHPKCYRMVAKAYVQ